ncbi:cupin domain-containing protein [Nocardia sp. NPDC052278]|uniref:cupin domain-containing protein n=1 Tax=unclassified Nocardia TaxID=2637762 RepID=UPI0036BE09D8
MPNRVIHAELDKLPQEILGDGMLVRTAVRGDESLITINWIHPGHGEVAPPAHSHPFDQVSFVFQGTLEFEVDDQKYVVSAGEVLQIPAGAPHTARVIGDEVALNVDVFAPVRKDYLHLVEHQADAFPAEAQERAR